MARYGVTAIHLGAQGRIERVRMQQMLPNPIRFVGELREYAAHEAAGLISVGDTLVSIFFVEGGNWVVGPTFKLMVYAHGFEGIELFEEVDGYQLEDIEQF